MEEQGRKLLQVTDTIIKKIQVIQMDGRQKEKQVADIVQQFNEVFSETLLFAQQQLSLEVIQILEKVFQGMKQLSQSLIIAKPEPSQQFQVAAQLQLPNFQNVLQLGNAQVLDYMGIPGDIRCPSQIPWNSYKSNGNRALTKQPRTFAEKGTSTVLDFYQNCVVALDKREERDKEVTSIIQYTNDTIHLISEALQNRVKFDGNHVSDSKELEKLIQEMNLDKFHLELAIKDIDWDSLKMSNQNFNHVQESIKTHIKEVQKVTAERIFKYFHFKQIEQDKKKSILNDMKSKIKQKIMKPDDCRCSIYVNDILNLKTKIELQQSEIQKQMRLIQERELSLNQKEIQIRVLENRFQKLEQENKDQFQKMETMQKDMQKYKQLDKKNSENQISVSNDEAGESRSIMKSSYMDSRNPKQSSQLTVQTPTFVQEQQQTIFVKSKNKMLERAVKLVSVLDSLQQGRRISQLTGILDQQTAQQLTELGELIKDIEERDFLEGDRQLPPSLEFDSKSIFQQAKSLQSQKQLDQDRLNQSRNKINDHSFTAQDESNNLLKVPSGESSHLKLTVPSQKKGNRRGSVNNVNKTRGSSIRQSDNLIQQESNPDIPLLSRSKSSQIKPSQQLSRGNSIKIRRNSNSNISTHGNKSQKQQITELLKNPYGKDQQQYAYTDRYFQEGQKYDLDRSNTPVTTDRPSNHQQLKDIEFLKSNNSSFVNSPTSPAIQQKFQTTHLKSVISETENSEGPSKGMMASSLKSSQTFQKQGISQQQLYGSPEQILQGTNNTAQKNYRWKQKAIDQIDEQMVVYQSKKTHTQKSSFTSSPRDQAIRLKSKEDQIKDYVLNIQEEQNRKNQEEKVYFSQELLEIADQEENDIINQALTKQSGFEIGSEVNEQILQSMFKNLEKSPEVQNILKVSGVKTNPQGSKMDYQEFKQFVTKMQAQHKKCGKDCVHLLRFYLRLGFVSTKYLNRRKIYKLSKPSIQPAFPQNY